MFSMGVIVSVLFTVYTDTNHLPWYGISGHNANAVPVHTIISQQRAAGGWHTNQNQKILVCHCHCNDL